VSLACSFQSSNQITKTIDIEKLICYRRGIVVTSLGKKNES